MTLSDEQKREIKDSQNKVTQTLRVSADGIEKHMYNAYNVLDHGFVRVIDYMGNDSSIVQAARVSYGEGTKKSRDDEGLIRYLMRHWHSTPFEMCEIKLHIKLPVFVARQWIRHRTANVNEYSARYSILDREFYIPDRDNLAAQSEINNQGRGEILTGDEAERVLNILIADSSSNYDNYEKMLNQENQKGLARELARMNLPMNIYTQWYWKIDLHNLFHFLRLRADAHAQYEIRVYSDAISKIVADWVPVAYKAFEDYRIGGAFLSEKAIKNMKKAIKGEEVNYETSNMTKGEWSELLKIFPDLLKGS